VAWVARPGETKPANGLLMVGRTQEEAESRVREWTAAGKPGY
jgi:hypothetical protein